MLGPLYTKFNKIIYKYRKKREHGNQGRHIIEGK